MIAPDDHLGIAVEGETEQAGSTAVFPKYLLMPSEGALM